jgi:lipopolysaccharide transport system ATP-binding protein
MAIISAKNIVIDFPILGMVGNRSFKKSLINIATGGVLAKDATNNISVRALDHLTFEFNEGDRVGLIGHNGSGKSTLLQVLAGIYEPTSGQIEINGRVTSMLGINLGMDHDETGIDNIYLRGRFMGLGKRQIDKLVDEIADFSGIGEFLHLPMRTYSSGMAMRLAFAITTSVEAEIILMDEWLSVGDADFVLKAKERLTKILDKARLVVIASHDHQMIADQCNIVYHLEHGKFIYNKLYN